MHLASKDRQTGIEASERVTKRLEQATESHCVTYDAKDDEK